MEPGVHVELFQCECVVEVVCQEWNASYLAHGSEKHVFSIQLEFSVARSFIFLLVTVSR